MTQQGMTQRGIIAALIAGVAFYAVGSIWYGVLFSELWMTESGFTNEGLAAGNFALSMGGGFIVALVSAFGIAIARQWRGKLDLMGSIQTAVILWLFFGLTGMAYGWLYSELQSFTLFLINASHLLVGWVAAAAVLSLIDKPSPALSGASQSA